MEAKSCISKNLDPYRAGIEIAEQLESIQPDVVFLFSSIQYLGSPELLEAIYAGLAPAKPILIGNTGDGIYAKEQIAEVGVSAMGIHSGKSVRWYQACQTGLRDSPYSTAKKCLEALLKACPSKPSLIFLASDFRTDSTLLLQALNEGTDIPIVGGLAADDYTLESCHVFAGQQVLSDAIVLVAAVGKIAFDIQLGQCPMAVGKPGTITDIDGTMLHSVDGIPTMDFLEREIGKPLDHVDKGILAFQTVHPHHAGERLVRSMLFPDDRKKERSVKIFGGVEPGSLIQLCTYPADRMIKDVLRVSQNASQLNFKPQAALIISCAGRKIILGDQIQNETLQLLQHAHSITALAGYPSFGEFAPLHRGTRYSPTLFHNMTYVLVLLGSPDA